MRGRVGVGGVHKGEGRKRTKGGPNLSLHHCQPGLEWHIFPIRTHPSTRIPTRVETREYFPPFAPVLLFSVTPTIRFAVFVGETSITLLLLLLLLLLCWLCLFGRLVAVAAPPRRRRCCWQRVSRSAFCVLPHAV